MNYRKLGSTGLEVSEIGFGGEWMDGSPEEVLEVVRAAEEAGINILDCWMNDATRRSNLGDALRELGSRGRWVIQGHLGSVTVDGQYTRTRDLDLVRPAFEDLLERLGLHLAGLVVLLARVALGNDVPELHGVPSSPSFGGTYRSMIRPSIQRRTTSFFR